MPGTVRPAARFPLAGAGEGLYESFYVKACHPSEPLAVWVRYTVHKAPGGAPTGSLWFTLFDAAAEGPAAVKATLPDPRADDGHLIRVGESVLTDRSARGRAEGEGRAAAWELDIRSDADPLFHLPRAWMYRSPLPRTKLLTPWPAARFDGWVEIDGRRVELAGWRGMVGHNWGAQHAERWIWMHADGFEQEPDAWLDVALGRIRVGPVTTPWIANGALCLGGERQQLGGVERFARTEVREEPGRCELVLPARDATLQVLVEAPRKDFVGWLYADPDGSEHNTINCSVSDITLTFSRPGRGARTLVARGRAAYELGMRETDHGIPIQPFPDG